MEYETPEDRLHEQEIARRIMAATGWTLAKRPGKSRADYDVTEVPRWSDQPHLLGYIEIKDRYGLPGWAKDVWLSFTKFALIRHRSVNNGLWGRFYIRKPDDTIVWVDLSAIDVRCANLVKTGRRGRPQEPVILIPLDNFHELPEF